MVKGEITIRLAGPEDADVIAHHRRAMFDDIKGPFNPSEVAAMDVTFVPYVRRALANGSYRGWLACIEGGRVVAGGGLIVHEWPASPLHPDPRRAYVINVFTEPAYRRQGIARRIIEAIIAWCRSQGLKRVSLHASIYGKPLYTSLGFRQTNEMQLWLGEKAA